MTAPTPRPIGLNKRPGSLFGLQSAPPTDEAAAAELPDKSAAVAPAQTISPAASKPAKTRAPRLSAAKALPAAAEDDDDEFGTVRVGLYLRSSVADRAQTAMSDFGTRHAREIRRRGARRNSLNAFLSAVLDHALENLDSVDPGEIISRMPKGGR
jgi:hypothetical protein